MDCHHQIQQANECLAVTQESLLPISVHIFSPQVGVASSSNLDVYFPWLESSCENHSHSWGNTPSALQTETVCLGTGVGGGGVGEDFRAAEKQIQSLVP